MFSNELRRIKRNLQNNLTQNENGGVFNVRKIIGLIVGFVLFIIGIVVSFSLFENVPAGYICVIQSPLSGELTVHTEPGLKWQGLGQVTMYPRTGLFEFDQPVNPYSEDAAEVSRYRKEDDNSHKITFNDGGAAYISGSIRYDYPMEKEKIEILHRMFFGHQAVIRGLVAKTVERSVYMSGPLMTSIDSFMSRRSDLPKLIEDQARNGLYDVVTKDVMIEDEFTKERKFVKQAEPVKDDKAANGLKRQDESIMAKYGLQLSNLSIGVNYDPKVQNRVNALFAAASDIQVATMNAKKAEQDRKTAEEKGKADATTAEWRAKAIAAEEIAKTEKEKKVAILNAEKTRDTALLDAERNLKVAEQEKLTAVLYKEAQIQRADADSNYKRKMMEADGALTQKLETYRQVSALWAEAFANYKGQLVPQIVTGNAGPNGPTTNGLNLIELLTVKTAKDLALDPKIEAKPSR